MYWTGETFAVYASSTGTELADFANQLYIETLSEKAADRSVSRTKSDIPQGPWTLKTIELPAGTKYVAIRHFDSEDIFAMNLDDLKIEGEAGGEEPVGITYTVLRDGEELASDLTETSFTESNLDPATYNYCVRANYGAAGLSQQVCVEAIVSANNTLAPVTNLNASVDGQNVTLTWTAPASKRAVILEEDFEEGAVPADWKLIDADGDGYNWEYFQYAGITYPGLNGSKGLSSASWKPDGIGGLTPDIWLITPELNFTGTATLTFWVCSQNKYFTGETFAVYASSTGTEVADFSNQLYLETLSEKTDDRSVSREKSAETQGPWSLKTIEIPAGTKYVAIRHFDSEDIFAMNLDNLKIETEAGGEEPVNVTYTVLRDGEEIASALTETSFTESNLDPATYNYCVRANYGAAGLSDQVCVEAIVSANNTYAPVTNLVAVEEGAGNVKLTWTPPVTRGEIVLNEDFEGGQMPAGWIPFDNDGDGKTWEVGNFWGYDGSNDCVSSASYTSSTGALNPDNYLITPALSLTDGGELKFRVAAQDANYAAEHYAICISTTGSEISDFGEPIFQETLTSKTANVANSAERGRVQGTWFERTITLPVGTKYVAFRHYNCSDQFWMNLDNIQIIDMGEVIEPEYTYLIKRGDETIAESLLEPSYTDMNLDAGLYEYCVMVLYRDGGLSVPVCTSIELTETIDFAPVTNLQGNFADGKVKLTWTAPVASKAVLINEGFEDGLPSTWTTIDADGDSYVWEQLALFGGAYFDGHESVRCIQSASWKAGGIGALTPNNYLVTPELNLPEGGTLTFWVCGQDAEWAGEHYAVYASKAGNTEADFTATTAIHEETMTAKQKNNATADQMRARVQGNWYERTVSLPAGTKYVAFRHFDSSDMFYLNLDDIKITTEGGGTDPVNDWTYNVYREGALLNNVATESYEDAYSTPGTYKYEVEVKYPGGVSPKVAVNVTITSGGGEGSSLAVLEAHDVWGDATGYILLMDKTASMYGVEIPASGPLVQGCDVPADLQGKFSHIIPTTGVIDCAPAADQWVVDGTAELVIEPGIYDYCIINPQPGVNVWIAGGDNARKDNFEVLAGKKYHFTAELAGSGDNILLEVSDWTGVEETLASSNKVYGIEGYIVIEAETGKANVYDIQGRRIATQQVNGKAMVPAQAGIYVVQLGKTASKVVVK